MEKNKCSETIKAFDIFPQELEVLFDNGKNKIQTHCGVVLGAIMISVLAIYGFFKAERMFLFGENII